MSLASNRRVAESIYDLLTNHEDARACRDIPDEACRVTPTNFSVLLYSYFLSQVGDAVANPKTVLAWVMTSVQAPVFMLGFLVPIRESGSLIPQLVIAGYVRRLPVRKWVWVVGSVIQALAMVGIGLVSLQLSGALAGWAILALLVLFSLARGLCSVAAKDVLGKTVPKGQRGQLTGWSASAAGFVTVGVGVALLLPLQAGDDTRLYGVAMIGAAALWVVAAATYSFIREFPGETDGGSHAIGEAFERLGLLIEDKPFRQFVIARSLLLCSALTAPYFVALGQSRIGGAAQVLGAFVIASGLAALLSAPFWGRLTDRSSRQVMTVAAALTATIGGVVAAADIFTPDLTSQIWFLPAAYFFLSVAHGGVRIGRKTYVVDLAGGNKRTDYVAVSNTVIGVVLLATGLVGTLASVISLAGVIVLLSIMGAAGAIYSLRLPETS